MWNEIKSQDDIDSFLEMYGWFHDGCIKELKYTSGAFVSKNLSMRPFDHDHVLRIVFQRQYRDPSVIEMEFMRIKRLHLVPADLNYDCIIMDTTMLMKDNYIYWCDEGNISENEIDDYGGTLIFAERVRWRTAEEFIGSDEVYRAVSSD